MLDPLVTEFRRAVTVGLASVPRVPGPKNSTAQHPGRELLEFCRHREDDVLRFTTDTTIWPTNNITERGVRPLKTQQKISGRLTSEDATQDRLDIHSYIDTARKHGHRPLDVLRRLFTGNAWRATRTRPRLSGNRPCPNPVTQRTSRITLNNRVNVYAGRYRDALSHVPHESRRSGSRRLHAGHHLASRRVSARLIPGQKVTPGFDAALSNNDASTANPATGAFNATSS